MKGSGSLSESGGGGALILDASTSDCQLKVSPRTRPPRHHSSSFPPENISRNVAAFSHGEKEPEIEYRTGTGA